MPASTSLVFHSGADPNGPSLCSARSLSFCEEAYVVLHNISSSPPSVVTVGRAYETVDPLTWNGDSAPGYLTKRSYSNGIGSGGVILALKAAFVDYENDVGDMIHDVCTSTGAIWHYMQATVQIFGARMPERCIAIESTWRTIAYTATFSTVTDGTSDSNEPAVAGKSTVLQNIATATLVVLSFMCLAMILVAFNKSGCCECFMGLARVLWNR